MINVYGFRKPTLEVETVAGGTLDASGNILCVWILFI